MTDFELGASHYMLCHPRVANLYNAPLLFVVGLRADTLKPLAITKPIHKGEPL